MNRLLLAGLLVLPFALARTGVRAEQDDAYGSLVSMADSAADDKGPEAGEIGAGLAGGRSSSAAPEAAKTNPEAPIVARSEVKADAPAPAPKRPRSAPRHDDGAPAVAVPAEAAPRVWTKVFSSLIPSMARVPAFEISASSAARRGRAEPERPATAASAAGAAQGLIELVAAATTPTAPQSAPSR